MRKQDCTRQGKSILPRHVNSARGPNHVEEEIEKGKKKVWQKIVGMSQQLAMGAYIYSPKEKRKKENLKK